MRVRLLIGRETILFTSVCLCTEENVHEIPIPPHFRFLTSLVKVSEIDVIVPGAYLCEPCSALVYAQLTKGLGHVTRNRANH